MKKNSYGFDVHRYAPELNKCYIWRNGWIDLKLPNEVVKQFQPESDYNTRLVRKYLKVKNNDFKFVTVKMKHSFSPFNEYTTPRSGCYKSIKEVKKLLDILRDKNQGYKTVYGENTLVKTRIYNKVEFDISFQFNH